jgi:hypothetical protein
MLLLFALAALFTHDSGAAPPRQPAPGPAAPAGGVGHTAGDAQADWLGRTQRDLAAREYEVAWQPAPTIEGVEASWHAPNRAQGFRTYFTAEGIRAIPRTNEASPWRWGLTLQGYGRGAASWRVPQAGLFPSGNRIDYRRGALQEWYENGPRGLEQGFVLPEPPEEAAASRRAQRLPSSTLGPGQGGKVEGSDLVHVDLALWGDTSPVVAADGQAIDFITPTGARAIRYAELRVTDARGAVLPAWMEGSAGEGGRGIRLVVNARGAVYPVTIDPLATSPVWTAESDQANAEFGFSVATAGDVNGDGFSDVIVGVPLYDDGQENEGRAFVYLGSLSGPGLNPIWSVESDQAFALLGYSVATAGDVNGDGYSDVIVGAYLYDNEQLGEGKAFVYLGSESGPASSPSWTAEGDQVNANFGTSVATAGDVNGDGFSDVVVGAGGYSNGQSVEGRAFVYLGSASGLGSSAAWTAESDQEAALFGTSVSTAGDVNGDGYSDVIVGAHSYDNGQTDVGRAFVYLGSASGLGPVPAWTAESDQAFADYGHSVATAGDVNGDGYSDVIVGASHYSKGQTSEGSAFIYLGSASGPGPSPAWTLESNQADAHLGVSVATAGDVNGDGLSDVIVGADDYDNGQSDEGRAFVYLGSASGPALSPGWTAKGDQYFAYLGFSVATAGDVNGDGFSDVIVGAFGYDTGFGGEDGRAFVYIGSASGLGSSPAWSAESDQYAAQFGASVATAGDVNGDGFSDVIIGAASYSNGPSQSSEGRALVYLGSASGLAPSPAWTAESNKQGAHFGASVATAGDVNGDGFSDVIVGAYNETNGQSTEGRAYVYLGSESGPETIPVWTAESDQAAAWFGHSVSTAGDVNGDGFSDIIVGAPVFANGQVDEGRAFVYLGSASGPGSTPAWTAESDKYQAQFGYSVATAGDVNGDGYSDIIVGAPFYTGGQLFGGRAFVYLGSASGLGTSPAWTAENNEYASNFGTSVATAGDVNGDGFSDVIVGAPIVSHGQDEEGRAYIYLGSASGSGSGPAWTGESDQAYAYFGDSVATAGDVNGDGFSDVIVGAYGYDNGQEDEGRAFLYYGSGGPGLSLVPRQRRSDDFAPIDLMGLSDSRESFRLCARGRTPFGRGLVKLEWEVKPFGTLFDGTATGTSVGWVDIGTAGATLDDLVGGLSPENLYHWRVRLRYHPATTPYQGSSRWFTAPVNGWQEADLRTPAVDNPLPGSPGDRAWLDADGNGIQDPGEPGMPNVVVALHDGSGALLESTVTDASGNYVFSDHPLGATYRVRFTPPDGYMFTPKDQGTNDALDSDADPGTEFTPDFVLEGPQDGFRWDAGFFPTCLPPDQAIFINRVRLTTDGNQNPILHFQDSNLLSQVTGYNVHRSSSRFPPPSTWPLVASNVLDMDAATPNIQWVDTSSDIAPGEIWYYQVVAFNSRCPAEGPF